MSVALVPGLEGDTILAQMNKLFEPPTTRKPETVGESVELHPYFKRPGKGHNHDCCDSCSEGGALICCDSCPSSFHLQCHDPPLSETDIPEGDWICIKCFAKKPENIRLVEKEKKNIDLKSVTRTINKGEVEKTGSNIKSPIKDVKSPIKDAVVDSEWKPGGKGRRLEVSKPSRATRMVKKATMYADNSTEDEDDEILKSVKTASLAPEFTMKAELLRTYKELYVDHLKQKPATVVNSPFSLLLAAAHSDNAVEFELPHSFDSLEKFPYSWKWSSADERRKRGQQGEEEGEARGSRPLCYVCVKSSRVGPLVKCDYCPSCYHMDCLDPPLSEMPSDVWMCPNHVEHFLDSKLLNTTSATERVKLWDKFARQPVNTHAIKLQFMKRCSRVKRHLRDKRVPLTGRNRVMVPAYIVAHYNKPASLLPGPRYERWEDPLENGLEKRANKGEGEETVKEMEWVSNLVSLKTSLLQEKLGSKEGDSSGPITEKKEEDHVKTEVTYMNQPASETDNGNNGLSPASTLSACSLSPRHSLQLAGQGRAGTGSLNSLASQLAEYLAEHSKHNIAAMDPVVVQYLAHRQLEALLPQKEVDSSQVVARASLTPLHSRRAPTYMTRRSLTVGIGSGAGLDLNSYGHCNTLSAKHAVIFYDELSGYFELINYSQHGVIVDEVVYSLDTVAVDARYPSKGSKVAQVVTMAGREGRWEGGCFCDENTVEGRSGCEGSALLHHGSLVQFGCLKFVFSIMQSGCDSGVEL